MEGKMADLIIDKMFEEEKADVFQDDEGARQLLRVIIQNMVSLRMDFIGHVKI
jgi:hypothetical protein